MAGTRTAPAFTATATGRMITIHLMDTSGDLFTDKLFVALAATAAAIEAWIAAYQAATNASVYAVTDTILRDGDADPDNAVAAFRSGVENGINLLFKNPTTRQTFTQRLIAPVAADMQGDQDVPLLSSTEMTDLITTTLALTSGYNFKQSQYTSHRERTNNPVIK